MHAFSSGCKCTLIMSDLCIRVKITFFVLTKGYLNLNNIFPSNKNLNENLHRNINLCICTNASALIEFHCSYKNTVILY